jgi:hypothetical protein
MRLRVWLGAGGAIAFVWLTALAGMRWLGHQRVTADQVIALVENQNLESLPPKQRAEYLDHLAESVNALEFEERQKLRQQEGLRSAIDAMTESERLAFMEKTLPRGFSQLLQSLNKMDPEKRQLLVRQALDDMKSRDRQLSDEDRTRAREVLDDEGFHRVVEKGFDAYLREASAETKLDLAPLMEQIQMNLQRLRQ